ncbi:unnamed protein product [Adineta steineri]|uniref:UBC core domain-containing protein n=1 Tax=Adineta steineri TaxID=433720 RepID=A0A819V159_9BILA|nr:unnamed protein product [Adineta steineri]CAF1482487.1 unnamed protein product [Adineta steineri]CAF4021208.1 unnamed protein product [Adineta steineri]CAF4103068.1 unnamed protein product [Adineta steineri]
MASKLKLINEWKNLQQNAHDYILAEPLNTDMIKWRAKITGPPDTPLEGGIFILDIIHSDRHPFVPPRYTMKTKMFHPNISSTGEIYISTFENDWSPSLMIRSILLSIFSILDNPVMDNTVNHEAARCFSENRTEYDSVVREYTLKYANASSVHNENEQDLPPTMLHTVINN